MSLPWRRSRRTAQPTTRVVVKAGDYTITLSGDALAALYDLAERRSETPGQVLAEALGLQRTIMEARDKGGRVIIQSRDEKPRELVLAS